jgi:hypothetical protein
LIVREYTVQGNVLYSLQCYTEPEFLNIQWRLKSRLFNESCLFKGQSVQQGLQWLQHFLLLLKIILCKQSIITLKLSKIIYICILYLKYLETFLETLHSHFQPSCHFKMFKNSGSGIDRNAMLIVQNGMLFCKSTLRRIKQRFKAQYRG